MRAGGRLGVRGFGIVALGVLAACRTPSADQVRVERPKPKLSASAEPKADLDSKNREDPLPELQRVPVTTLPTDPKMPIEEPARHPVVTQVVASELEGKLSPEQVMNTIDQNASRLVGCLSTDSVISVKLKVLPSGKIGMARAVRSIPNDPKLRDCIESAIRKISFPKLEGSEPANLSLDLSLRKT